MGSDMRNSVSVGKNPLSLHMAHKEHDKYRDLNRAMSTMIDESCFTEVLGNE